MWKYTFALLMFILIFVGCTPPANSASIPTKMQATEPIPTATSSAITLLPTSTVSLFSEIKLGHHVQNAFSKNPDFHLIVKDTDNKIGVLNFSNMDTQNKQLLSDSIVNLPVVSENGGLLAQIIRQENSKLLKIINSKTNEERIVPLPKEAVMLQWLSQDRLAIWGGSDHMQCLELLMTYDNATDEISYPIHPVPELQKSQCLQLPTLTSSGTKMIYPWEVFDTTTGTSTDVFPFMNKLYKYPPAYSLKEGNGKVSIAYLNGNVLYYLLNTPLDKINDKNLKPEVVALPGLGTSGAWWQPLRWSSFQKQIAMDLVDRDVDPEGLLASSKQVPTKFYILDFSAQQLINYELDRAVFTDGALPQKVYDVLFSPDDKYVAWTIYDSLSGLPIGSKILELSSGAIVAVPEMEVIGWSDPKAE
jgi:hypothetical protein